MRKNKYESNNTVDDRIRRVDNLSCSFCRPNKGENANRQSKHGHRKLNKTKRG